MNTAEGLVVANMKIIARLERPILRNEPGRGLLLSELLSSAIGHFMRNESTMLLHHLAEGLVFVQNFVVKLSLFIAGQVFFALVRVLPVTDSILISEGLRGLPVVETTGSLAERCETLRSLGVQTILVFEFGGLDGSVARVRVSERCQVAH